MAHADAATGKKVFAAKGCASCHRANGSGGFKPLPSGNPSPNWKDPKTWADPKRTDDYLRDCITNGKPQSGMIAWGRTGLLTPAQIEDLIAYIRTFSHTK